MVFSRISHFIRRHDEEVQYQAWRFMFVLIQVNAFLGLMFLLSDLGLITS